MNHTVPQSPQAPPHGGNGPPAGLKPALLSVVPVAGTPQTYTEASMLLARYNPLEPGPLPSEIADTFRSASYSQQVALMPIPIYRTHGGRARQLGWFWTRLKPLGRLQALIDFAIHPAWGNYRLECSVLIMPPGTIFYEGPVAAQGPLVGGGNQIFLAGPAAKWLKEECRKQGLPM